MRPSGRFTPIRKEKISSFNFKNFLPPTISSDPGLQDCKILDMGPDAQQLSSLSEAVDAYDSTLTQLLDKYSPLKSVKFNPKKNLWWNEKCQEARNMKRRVERTYKKHKDPDKQEFYKEKYVDARHHREGEKFILQNKAGVGCRRF